MLFLGMHHIASKYYRTFVRNGITRAVNPASSGHSRGSRGIIPSSHHFPPDSIHLRIVSTPPWHPTDLHVRPGNLTGSAHPLH
jgi:hypothetical protein